MRGHPVIPAAACPPRTATRGAALRANARLQLDLRSIRLFDANPVPSLVIRPNGVIAHANPAACRLLGYATRALSGTPLCGVLPDTNLSHHSLASLDGDQHPTIYQRLSAIHADGKKCLIDMSINALWDEQELVFVAALSSPPQDLQTYNQTVIQEMQNARDAAQAAVEAKGAFLANISHEIRTPLNAIIGMAQVGERNVAGSPSAKTFHQILESGQHLLALINDILDFSKMEAGKLSIQDDVVQTAELLRHLVSVCATRAQAKRLTFAIEESTTVPVSFTADETRCAQVLINLLSNAIKFTQYGGVKLHLSVAQDQLVFDVSDSGSGLTELERSRLFQPFEQFHTHLPNLRGGTGLGLAISKRLAEWMGGNIELLYSSHDGSAFRFHIPLRQRRLPHWHLLKSVHAWGLDHELHNLAPALAERDCCVNAIRTLDDTKNAAIHVLLASPKAIHRADQSLLLDMIRRGVKVIIIGPESDLGSLPEDVLSIANQLALPVSPPRLLDALDQIKATIPSPSIPKRLAGLRVLAAEDNPVNRLVLEQMLAQEGAQVAFGHDGAQALELVRTHGAAAFDIVLCDIQMPVMDGFETTLALARIAPGLSVIGLTAHAFETAKAHAREVGMVDYVTKPYMLDTLVEVILKHAKKAPSATNNLTENASSQAVPRGHTDSGLSDCQAMLSHFGSNPILLQRLVETLNETSQEILSNLTQAIESRDFNLIRTEAHSLKGAALNLHTPGLAKQATELQNLASLQAPVAFNMAKELIDNLTHFIDQIQASEKVNPTPSKP